MEVISSCHMNLKDEVLYPHGWVCYPVVLLYVNGFKPFRELMLHHLVCEAQWVGSASDPSYVMPMIGGRSGPVLFPTSIVAVEP